MSDSSFDKVQFLIVCIKHTSNGRVSDDFHTKCYLSNADGDQPDFQKVSDELSLPSKGAA